MNNKYGERSIEYYIEKYYEDVYRFVYSMVYNKDDAFDITQSTMEKSYKNRKSLRKTESAKAWLFSIAKRETFSFFEKSKKEYDREAKYTEFIEKESEAVIADSDILNILINKENFAELSKAWEMLDEKSRRLIALWTSGGYSEKEIAKMLNMNYNTVRTNLRRGIKKLKELYTEAEKGGKYDK